MPKKKSSKAKKSLRLAAPAADLPQPRQVPKAQVGEAIQDFIDFGSAKAVEAHEETDGMWQVTATA